MVVDASQLAEALFIAKGDGARIPPPCDMSIDQGYAVQERSFRLRQVPIAAWKLALTSKAGQQAMGVDDPVVGRLAATDVKTAPHEDKATPGPLYVEAELVVTVARDLPPRTRSYDPSEVAAAIGPTYAAIELCTSRFDNDDVGAGLLVADNAFAHVLVLGDRLGAAWDGRFAAAAVTLRRASTARVQGSTSAVMGNPLHALAWLANWLSNRGQGLERGQIVATGSCTGVIQIFPGEKLRASFANMGEATVAIASRE